MTNPSATHVLLVEDDADVRRALVRSLRRAGYRVSTAGTASAARARDALFDVAVVDLDLPDGDGSLLAAHLRKTGRVRRVVFFTASLDSARLARARRIGVVVAKDPAALLRALPPP